MSIIKGMNSLLTGSCVDCGRRMAGFKMPLRPASLRCPVCVRSAKVATWLSMFMGWATVPERVFLMACAAVVALAIVVGAWGWE